MSYARFGWEGSDVYIFNTDVRGEEVITCCGCLLNDHDFYGDATSIIDHLNQHVEAGQHVEEQVYTDIICDYLNELDIEDIIMNKVQRVLDNFVTTYDKQSYAYDPGGYWKEVSGCYVYQSSTPAYPFLLGR